MVANKILALLSATVLSAVALTQSCIPVAVKTTAQEPAKFDSSEYFQTLELDTYIKLGINLNIVRDFESVDTNVYWPGGLSGPTIGAGIDLGHTGIKNITAIFHGLVDSATMAELMSAAGVQGKAAVTWVDQHKSLKITRRVSNIAFMRTCQLYWNAAVLRFGPELKELDPTVKGVVLSVVMNYGPNNKALAAMQKHISARDMYALANAVKNTQTTNKDSSIRKALARRRKLEHDVILLASNGSNSKEVRID